MKTSMIPAWAQEAFIKTKQYKEPHWLSQFRQKQWDQVLLQGLPTQKHERFKYADMSLFTQDFSMGKKDIDLSIDAMIDTHRLKQESIVLVFVNGCFMQQYADLKKLPPSVIVCPISDAIQHHDDLVKTYWPQSIDTQHYPFASINASLFYDGLFFYLPQDCKLSLPVHFLFLTTEEEAFTAHPMNLIVLSESSELLLFEEHVSLSLSNHYLMNGCSKIHVGKNAKFHHYKFQNENHEAIHMTNTFLSQDEQSEVTSIKFSLGARFSRDEWMIKLNEPGASCYTKGYYELQHDQQYMDHHVDIFHLAPRCQSDMLYKGIINKKSRAVFNGKLYVDSNAQKTIAYQANHNLLLAEHADVYSKPELEIYADDVQCKHGVTIGQLDQDALFYLRTKGIAEDEAINMLLRGFRDEILQSISHPTIKQYIINQVSDGC